MRLSIYRSILARHEVTTPHSNGQFELQMPTHNGSGKCLISLMHTYFTSIRLPTHKSKAMIHSIFYILISLVYACSSYRHQQLINFRSHNCAYITSPPWLSIYQCYPFVARMSELEPPPCFICDIIAHSGNLLMPSFATTTRQYTSMGAGDLRSS